jgi:hypothetical protein
MITNAELSSMVSKQIWTEKIVDETFDGVPDCFNKKMAQMAMAQAREHLEDAISIHMSRDDD